MQVLLSQEAMSFGIPIVHFGVAGTQDYFLDDVNSVLSEDWEPTTTARTLFHLLTDSPRMERIGGSARLFVERFLSVHASALYANSVFRRIACQAQLRAASEMALVLSASAGTGDQNSSWIQVSLTATLLIPTASVDFISRGHCHAIDDVNTAVAAVFSSCSVVVDVSDSKGRSFGIVQLPYLPDGATRGIGVTLLVPEVASELSAWVACPGQRQLRLYASVSLRRE
jgi:hypothetical protein